MGQTINAEGREKAHRANHGESGPVVLWKFNLAEAGLQPVMHILGRVQRSSARRAERCTIGFCLSSQARLLNWFGSPIYQNGPGRSRLFRGVGFGKVVGKTTKRYRDFLLQHYPQVHEQLFKASAKWNSNISAVPSRSTRFRLPLVHKGHRLKPYGPTPRMPDETFEQVTKSYVTVTPNCPFCEAKGTLRQADPPFDSMTDGQIQDYETGFREYLRCSKCGKSFWQTAAGQIFAISRGKA